MKNHLIRKAVALILSCLVLTGCGQTGNVPDKTQSSDNSITVTDLAGVTHTFSQPLKKVGLQWSCAGGPFMTMSALLGDEIADYIACIDDSPEKYRGDMCLRSAGVCLRQLPHHLPDGQPPAEEADAGCSGCVYN